MSSRLLLYHCSHIKRTGSAKVQEDGAVAQLGERLNGIQEVRGSIPLGSTNRESPKLLGPTLPSMGLKHSQQ